ncbi:hypothetical protein CAPTEDRAFT_194673 [Capitella teleta]|uniref:VWFD domain-containing protein n=1 Tax=Capitella teleta TaxID=283909 RepID=R7VIB2_CAPTE|nr:hypothetical protein CAPTEDRAFT_194673 [Capitella teleta]|eukprot:ELU18583.1 hypothetical protein CAPTEDRAFT_194673 [Capitella teleta]
MPYSLVEIHGGVQVSKYKDVCIHLIATNRENEKQRVNLKQGLEVTHDHQQIEEFPQIIDGHKFEMVPAVRVHHLDWHNDVTEVISYTLPNGVNIQYDGITDVKINNDALDSETARCGLCGNDDGVFDERGFVKGYNVDGDKCENLYAQGPALSVDITLHSCSSKGITNSSSDWNAMEEPKSITNYSLTTRQQNVWFALLQRVLEVFEQILKILKDGSTRARH